MGRPEKPVDGPYFRQQLALYLRGLRIAAGPTYEQMATYVKVSPATLKRAASGKSVPTFAVAMTFCVACMVHRRSGPFELSDLQDLWLRARMEERGTLRLRKPKPEYIADTADLSQALRALYEHAGAPPLRTVQKKAGGAEHLPLTTLSRIIARETLPVDLAQFKAFLRGCGVSPGEAQEEWAKVWRKIHATVNLGEMTIRYRNGGEIVERKIGPLSDGSDSLLLLPGV
ncbi:helix-turn-helix domain-containing protein [Streptomyces californicus]|uniref:helix-turn-helix domain-containing protein n=1 Tax=Streptomyces californicus TaxID=67351 RepID=UPI0037BBCC04